MKKGKELIITDDQAEHYPIKTLCWLTHELPFQDKGDFARLRLIMKIANLMENVCERDLRSDLLIDPLIRNRFLPDRFVFYQSSDKKPRPDVLQVRKLLHLMQLVGVVTPETLAGKQSEELGNQDIISLMKTGKYYRSQHPLNGRDDQGKDLVLYSRETRLTGVNLDVTVRELMEDSKRLDVRSVAMSTGFYAYANDYAL